jgi:hypothetical protein
MEFVDGCSEPAALEQHEGGLGMCHDFLPGLLTRMPRNADTYIYHKIRILSTQSPQVILIKSSIPQRQKMTLFSLFGTYASL